MVIRLSALRTGRPLLPGRFLVLLSVTGSADPRAIVRLEGLSQLKNPMTSSGIEAATFRLAVWYLKELRSVPFKFPCRMGWLSDSQEELLLSLVEPVDSICRVQLGKSIQAVSGIVSGSCLEKTRLLCQASSTSTDWPNPMSGFYPYVLSTAIVLLLRAKTRLYTTVIYKYSRLSFVSKQRSSISPQIQLQPVAWSPAVRIGESLSTETCRICEQIRPATLTSTKHENLGTFFRKTSHQL
jgi:hypothetical protein